MLVAATDPTELVPLEEVEKRYILRVLEAVGGNKTLAAQVLGLDRKTLYRKLEEYGREGGDEPAPDDEPSATVIVAPVASIPQTGPSDDPPRSEATVPIPRLDPTTDDLD